MGSLTGLGVRLEEKGKRRKDKGSKAGKLVGDGIRNWECERRKRGSNRIRISECGIRKEKRGKAIRFRSSEKRNVARRWKDGFSFFQKFTLSVLRACPIALRDVTGVSAVKTI